MSRPAYDFYRDMLETHTEVGYLLAIVLTLGGFDVAVGVALWRWPADDVYLVPGDDRCGAAPVVWGAVPPGAATAVVADDRAAPRIDLSAAAVSRDAAPAGSQPVNATSPVGGSP